MAWGATYTASATFSAAATTGTWKNATGGAIVLPAAPSGADGMVAMYHTSSSAAISAVVTALTTSSWGVSQIVPAASGYIAAIVGHSIIA